MKIYELSVGQIKSLLDSREISAAETVDSFYARLEEVEPEIHAFLYIRPQDEMLDEARQIDTQRVRGAALSPLAGIPIAIKDNISVAGMPLTCSSKILKGFVSPYDATVVARLRAAGMLFMGKTNMDEFGMGSSTENSAFFPTTNPRNLSYVPGGTSGGSAAAVAARQVPVALGSDTGGSIRQPASFCGVVGLKPSYGRVSRYGLVAYASSLDQVGVLASSVLDTASLLSLIAGLDLRDSTSLPSEPGDYFEEINRAKGRRLRVGIPLEYTGEGIDTSVCKCLNNCAELLASDGFDIIDVSLPHTRYALPTYYILSSCEASSNLARYDGVKYGFRASGSLDLAEMMLQSRSFGFGAEVKRRIMLGTFALSHGYKDEYYVQATRMRNTIRLDFMDAFEHCDLLLHPVAPTPAWRLGEKLDDPLKMYMSDILSVPASLAGLPAIVIPCGLSPENLPIGLQATGPFLGESQILAFAWHLEQLLHVNSNIDNETF